MAEVQCDELDKDSQMQPDEARQQDVQRWIVAGDQVGVDTLRDRLVGFPFPRELNETVHHVDQEIAAPSNYSSCGDKNVCPREIRLATDDGN